MPDRRYPSDSWLTPRARVGPSPIEGHGLFATRAIDRDEPVMAFGGAVLDNEALAAVPPPYSSVAVAEDTNLLLDPAHPVRYGNHSCDPNL
ncbi:SET domain-containing protein [Polymorphospora sp. NPDC050346]|uniref:SET domain-containing protein n=1 Tax=Polymorphospora sp. NPDC050346 TaxID=3155780 RepID=UPI0033E14283